MLHTASFYDPQDWKGRCFRVSRAHPRGRRPQWETAPAFYPQRELLKDYRSGTLDFTALERAYRLGLDAAYAEQAQFREWLHELPALGDFTLLCFERGEKPCHRRIAARWLLECLPKLYCGELK